MAPLSKSIFISYLLLHNKLTPKDNVWLKTTNYLIISVGRVLLGPLLWISHRAGPVVSSEGLIGEVYISKFTHMVVVRIQFLMSCWAESFSSLLANVQRPPLVPCFVGFFTG